MRNLSCINVEEVRENEDEIINFLSFILDGVYHTFTTTLGDCSSVIFECKTLIRQAVDYHSPVSIALWNGNILTKPNHYYTRHDGDIFYCLCFHEEDRGRWKGYNSYGKLPKDCTCLRCKPEQMRK